MTQLHPLLPRRAELQWKEQSEVKEKGPPFKHTYQNLIAL